MEYLLAELTDEVTIFAFSNLNRRNHGLITNLERNVENEFPG